MTRLLVGVQDHQVGKTSLLTRLMQNKILVNPKPTVGVSEQRQDLERDGVALHVKYCDTAGHEAYRAMSQVYLNNAQGAWTARRKARSPSHNDPRVYRSGVMVVYDISSAASFEHCKAWLEDVRENVRHPPLLAPCASLRDASL